MNKKIYYVAHCRFPSERAHAIQIAKMVEAMRLSGHDVELVVPRRKNIITESPRQYYGLSSDIPVTYLPVIDLYRFGRMGYILSGCFFMLRYILLFLQKQIRGEKFALYTIDMDQFSLIGVGLLGIPFVLEVHDSKKKGLIFNYMFRCAKVILTINHIIKKELVENFNITPEKIVVSPNGIDLQMFTQDVDRKGWRDAWSLPNDRPVVLYVGKCYDWKGLEIVKEVISRLPEITFAFVGCTREEVEGLSHKKYEQANAFFFGQRPYAEIPSWMKSADVLLVTGTKKNPYSYLHTSPMKLFECLATGVPIITANTPAIRDMVTKHEVSFYEPDDADSLVTVIKDVLNNPDEVRTITTQALVLAKKLSWATRAQNILSRL